MTSVAYTADLAARSGHGFSHRLAVALGRIRYQLMGGLLFAVAAPYVLRGQLEQLPDEIASYDNSVIGTFCALLIGFMIYRKMTSLPGARALTNVLPAFVTSYAVIVVLFFLLRLDYSRYQFLASFVLVVSWFALLQLVLSRLRQPTFVLVPFGRASALKSIRNIRWIDAPKPEVASDHPTFALVADFKSSEVDGQWQRYIADAAISGRPVYNAKQLMESLGGRVQVEHLSENSFGHLSPDSLYGPAKRYIDFVTALFALIGLAPFLLLVATIIRLDSPGPAVFKQRRMGYRGKSFTLWKFRSMRTAEEGSNTRDADMTKSDDERITRIGRFIRKTRIDELPQIFNILSGEMSWIGPRPETLNLSEWY